MTGIDRSQIEESVLEFARCFGCHMVLKGPSSLVCGFKNEKFSPDSPQTSSEDRFGNCTSFYYSHNNTGNSGMATAGSGDVLTGVLAALLGTMPPTAETMALAVRIHGLAGDIAAEQLGQISMTAVDIISCLAAAFSKV